MSRVVDVCFAKFVPLAKEYWKRYEDVPQLQQGAEIEIAPGLVASCLSEELRERINGACQTAGYNLARGSGDNLTYGFVRDNAPGGQFDADGVLRRLLMLSRVIYPSRHGFDCSGSLHFEGNNLEAIFGVNGAAAFGARDNRSWLTPDEMHDLGTLFRAYNALPAIVEPHPKELPWWKDPPPSNRKLPKRLQRALWNLAYSATVQPSHVRWLILATTAEGIIETGKAARREFITRLPAIGDDVGVTVTKAEADTIYGLRSSVAHSGWFGGKDDEELDSSYRVLDRFVAGAIRKSIFEPGFAAHFENRDSVMARWPVEVPAEVT